MGKGKKTLMYLLGGIIVLGLLGAMIPRPETEAETTTATTSAVNVTVSGWTFSTDEESWRVYDELEVLSYDSSDPDWEHPCTTNALEGNWKGIVALYPFYFPAYPNAPKDNENYWQRSAYVDHIYVVKIPEDLKKSLQEHNIAVYGSLDKIPEDAKEKDIEYILKDATRIPTMCIEWDSEENIDFNGYKAHLAKEDGADLSSATIAILLDEDTVGVISSSVMLESYMEDATYYDGRAEDAINLITFAPHQRQNK